MTSWMSQANSVEQSRVGAPQQADFGPSRQIPLGVVVGIWDCVKSGACGLFRLKRVMGLAVGSARPKRVSIMLGSPILTKFLYLEPRIRAGWWCSQVAQLSAVVANVVESKEAPAGKRNLGLTHRCTSEATTFGTRRLRVWGGCSWYRVATRHKLRSLVAWLHGCIVAASLFVVLCLVSCVSHSSYRNTDPRPCAV